MRNKKCSKAIIIIVFAVILLCSEAILYLLIYGELPKVYRDSSHYGQWDDFDGYSGLKAFPKEVSEQEIQEYYYMSQDTIFSPHCQIYMRAQYDEEAFQTEMERLKNIKVQGKNQEENSILMDKKSFRTQAFVCEYAWSDCYEYALVFDETNTVVYIYLQNMEQKDIEFDEEFLPYEYGEENDSYCIYGFGIGKNVMYYN